MCIRDSTYTGTGIGGEIGHETGEGSDIHFVAKGKKFTSASSLDYIRYICAQHGVCAVSYTHLDVYKRQPMNSSGW